MNPLSASVHQFAEKYLKAKSQIPQEAAHRLQTNIGDFQKFGSNYYLLLGGKLKGPMSRKEFSLYLQAFLQVEFCTFNGASYNEEKRYHGRSVESMEEFPKNQLYRAAFSLQCPVGHVTVLASPLASK